MEITDLEEEEFEFSRNYFLAKESGTSGKRSTHKLSDINLVDEQELREATSNIEPKHEKEIVSLVNSYKSLYPKWAFELRTGFGLLLYGFGSKKALIEDFASTVLTEYSVVVINGYLQSINLKQVLITLCELLTEQLKVQKKSHSGSLLKCQQSFNTLSMNDLITFLDGPYVEGNECFIYVVIHNIDGPGLRDCDTQQYLARIAACSHVRIVASIDHVNAQLLWDKKMVHTQFNWCWYHVPTFSPYKVEGIFFPLILAHGGTTQSVKTATIVLQSLTPNAQSVFKVLAEYQLANPDEEGYPINNLYSTCRERFLVSSQVTLNSHLTEFKDHELVKLRKHSDGQDCLYIPMTKEALEKSHVKNVHDLPFWESKVCEIWEKRDQAMTKDEYQLVRDCIAGQIFDSTPVDFTSDLGTKFLLHPTVQKRSHPPLIASWIAHSFAYTADTFFLSKMESLRAQYWQTLYGTVCMGAPYLILCSEDDDLAYFPTIFNFAQRLRDLGGDVKLVKWSSSSHVGHYRRYPVDYKAAVTELLGKAAVTYSRRVGQLEGEKMGFEGTRDEVPESLANLGGAALSSDQTFQNRVALELNDHFFVPSSVEYHGDRVVGSIHDNHKESYVTLTKPPVINAHGILGKVLFDVCVPEDVDNWDIKPSSFVVPPSSYSKKSLPFNPIKCIRRSRL